MSLEREAYLKPHISAFERQHLHAQLQEEIDPNHKMLRLICGSRFNKSNKCLLFKAYTYRHSLIPYHALVPLLASTAGLREWLPCNCGTLRLSTSQPTN